MLETWHVCLDSVYLVLMRTVTCLFMRLDLENQFLLKILFLYFYEFHCDVVKPDNVICERGEIHLHVLWARLSPARQCFVGKKELPCGPVTSKVQGQHYLN